MNAFSVILNQVLVKQFYHQNRGFFLILFIVAFGIQQPPSLLLLPVFLKDISASPLLTSIVLGVLFLYYLKCFGFIKNAIELAQNQFLSIAAVLPNPELNFGLAKAHISIFLPALLYSLWLGFIGYSIGAWFTVAAVLLFNSLLLGFSVYYFQKVLKNYPSEESFQPLINLNLKGASWLWPLRAILREDKVMLLITKLFSIMLLYSFNYMYPYLEFDLRPPQIGFLLAVTVNAMVIRQIQDYEESAFQIGRNLPLSRSERFGRILLLLAVILLPEFLSVIRFLPTVTIFLPVSTLTLFGLAYSILICTIGFTTLGRLEIYMRRVFFLFISLLLLFLINPPLLLVCGILFLSAYLLFYYNYYQYERPLE